MCSSNFSYNFCRFLCDMCRFQFKNERSLRLCFVCLCFCLACQCRFFQQQNFNEVTVLWFQKMWQPICIYNFVMHFDLHGWCSFLSFVSNTMPLNFKCTVIIFLKNKTKKTTFLIRKYNLKSFTHQDKDLYMIT
jgi:hypothetical protein